MSSHRHDTKHWEHRLEQEIDKLEREAEARLLNSSLTPCKNIAAATNIVRKAMTLFDDEGENSLPQHFRYMEQYLSDNYAEKHHEKYLIRQQAFGSEAQADIATIQENLRIVSNILSGVTPPKEVVLPRLGSQPVKYVKEKQDMERQLKATKEQLKEAEDALEHIRTAAHTILARFVVKYEEAKETILPLETYATRKTIADDVKKHPKGAQEFHRDHFHNDPLTHAGLRMMELRGTTLPELDKVEPLLSSMLRQIDAKLGKVR